MPAYDYTCTTCNEVREVVKTIKQFGEPVHCEKCGERMHRTFRTAPRVTYRGDGWTGAQRRG